MGRGRGKGKKQTFIANNEDQGSGEDQKNPAHRRRGRPQKPLKNGVVEGEKQVFERIEENGDESKGNVINEDFINDAVETNNGRKRSRSTEAGENIDSLEEEENGGNTKTNMEKTIISVGFRQIGSRRKNKPRRAAEVGVECN